MNNELDAMLAMLAKLTPEDRARLAARLVAGDLVSGDKVVDSQGTVNVGADARINGVAVGVTLGSVVYGRAPEEDERRRLVWYLDRLASKLFRLPLRSIEQRLDQAEGVALPHVYVMLATVNRVVEADDSAVLAGYIQPVEQFYQDGDPDKPLKEDYDPDRVLPDRAIIAAEPIVYRDRREREVRGHRLYRALLATEAVQQHSHLVLLGDPGGGKSTFVRHLAWAIAQRGLEQGRQAPALFGWPDDARVLPLLLSVRTLASRIATDGTQPAVVVAALSAELATIYNVYQAEALVEQALHSGVALLLLDGLDEVPLEDAPGRRADRSSVLRIVREFAQIYPHARVVLTCRTRAFDEAMRAELGWHVETIAPLTLGQVRHFVPAWYAELVNCRQLELPQAERMSHLLLDTIVANPKLRSMAETPLLLTMMALVLYNQGELPRDRPQLYERIIALLLGQWDKMRDGQSLTEAIGVPDWDSERIRPLLDQISYLAHANATSQDGRGRLARKELRYALTEFLARGQITGAWEAAERCLNYFDERTGLLIPDTDDTYGFSHQTLQEHGAGRYMVFQPQAVDLVLRHRADDRWREPILLGLGVVQQTNPHMIERILYILIDREENGIPKLTVRWQRDLILAAEIGTDRDWGYLRTQRINVDRLQRDLRRGLVVLLDDKSQLLPTVEREHAGFLLGELSDPRFPVMTSDWQRELARAQAGDTTSYFCRVEPGTYIIGSSNDDPDADEAELPQHPVTFNAPFWIARYPITNAQWMAWVEQAGGSPSSLADNPDINRPNQPVVGVTFNEAKAYCDWLTAQLDAPVRLPTEQEWEAAARGSHARHYPWGNNEPAEGRTIYDESKLDSPAPVGIFPAGAAECGALDMVGNVWEWVESVHTPYPDTQKPSSEREEYVLRGGGWSYNRARVRSGARDKVPSTIFRNDQGIRVLLSPRNRS